MTSTAVFVVRGHVQGVGFRYWAQQRARELGLLGHALNTPNGRVEILAQGPSDAVEQLAALLEPGSGTTSRPGSVVQTTRADTQERDLHGFAIG